MAINEWKIWQKLGWIKPKIEVVDVQKDLNAVITFIKEETPILRKLLDHVLQMQELRKKQVELERTNASPEELQKNLLDQLKEYDETLKLYEFYDLDVDINAARIKKVAREIKRKALESGVSAEWQDTLNKAERWNFNW